MFLSVDKTNVPSFVGVDHLDFHVGGCAESAEGAVFATYKPSREGTNLIKCQSMGILKEFQIIFEI